MTVTKEDIKKRLDEALKVKEVKLRELGQIEGIISECYYWENHLNTEVEEETAELSKVEEDG